LVDDLLDQDYSYVHFAGNVGEELGDGVVGGGVGVSGGRIDHCGTFRDWVIDGHGRPAHAVD
jgi:hypothetical protein